MHSTYVQDRNIHGHKMEAAVTAKRAIRALVAQDDVSSSMAF